VSAPLRRAIDAVCPGVDVVRTGRDDALDGGKTGGLEHVEGAAQVDLVRSPRLRVVLITDGRREMDDAVDLLGGDGVQQSGKILNVHGPQRETPAEFAQVSCVHDAVDADDIDSTRQQLPDDMRSNTPARAGHKDVHRLRPFIEGGGGGVFGLDEPERRNRPTDFG